MVHWIGNQLHALTPSPSPTERRRGELTVVYQKMVVKLPSKAPRPRHGRGVGVRASSTTKSL
ncbi:hypothetical protein JOD20_002949 [Herpetosiphon giganteus]|nr:hypothetical protein [Herpetosiphon giganteus]